MAISLRLLGLAATIAVTGGCYHASIRTEGNPSEEIGSSTFLWNNYIDPNRPRRPRSQYADCLAVPPADRSKRGVDSRTCPPSQR